jgi:hypothetical protein
MASSLGVTVRASSSDGTYFGQPLEERQLQQRLPKAPGALWALLHKTKITENDKLGIFKASHPPEVQALAGKTLTVTGFMMPLDTTPKVKRFLLTRFTPVCPFCPPGAPNEVVDVTSAQPVAYTEKVMTVTGKFSLMNDGEKGLFFHLDGATVARN